MFHRTRIANDRERCISICLKKASIYEIVLNTILNLFIFDFFLMDPIYEVCLIKIKSNMILI